MIIPLDHLYESLTAHCGCRSCRGSGRRPALRGDVLLDGLEEVAEPAGAMKRLGLADDPAGPGGERGEQASRSVARVDVGSAFDLSGAHRQPRRRAVERLNRALLVHAEQERAVRAVRGRGQRCRAPSR